MRRTPWIAISATFVLNGALFGIWASRIPAVKEQHDLSPSILGLLLLLLAGGAILMFPLAGRLVDGIGAARTTRILAIAYAIALPLIALAPDFWFLAAALFVFGACHGGMDVAMNAWGAEAERASGRSFMSSLHAMFSLGAGLGAASGWLAVQIRCVADGTLRHGFAAYIRSGISGLRRSRGQRGPRDNAVHCFPCRKGALLLVGIIAFASSMGEGAMADWSANIPHAGRECSGERGGLGLRGFLHRHGSGPVVRRHHHRTHWRRDGHARRCDHCRGRRAARRDWREPCIRTGRIRADGGRVWP